MVSPLSTITLKAQCLCTRQTFSTSIPVTSLPLPAVACHCTSCRHVTGALYSIDTPWPQPRHQVDTSTLTTYAFSPNLSVLFCGTCSTPIFFESNPVSGSDEKTLGVFTGVLQNLNLDGGELVKIIEHIFVADTLDGGASVWLQTPNADGALIPRYLERNTTAAYPSSWPPPSELTGFEKKTEGSEIPIRCHCKGVDLLLHRGEYKGKKDEERPWFIDPQTGKHLASFDVCDSCRLQSGIDIFHWTFAELRNISSSESPATQFPSSTNELKKAVDAKDPLMGRLAYYESSKDVQRYFCGLCSATVFYAVNERPLFVDIAVGVLDSGDGARAEGWLSWALGGTVSHEADVGGGWRDGLVGRVKGSAEEWRVGRGYPKNWRRVLREEEAKKKGQKGTV